jgi:hypothetical protein
MPVCCKRILGLDFKPDKIHYRICIQWFMVLV